MRQGYENVTNATVPIIAIKPHPENYNQHPDEQIRRLGASYDALGQFRSVVLWQQLDGSYIQLAGHGVVEAMKREGATEVRADILPPSLDAMTANGYLGSGGQSDDDEEEDELPEEVETRAKPGDIWQLGRHRICCLDSCDPETYRRLFLNVSPHMVWSDPPYGIEIVATNGYVGGGEAYDIPFGGVKNRTRGDVGGGASHIRKTGMTYMESNEQKKVRGSVGANKRVGDKDISMRGTDGASHMVEAGKYFPVIGDEGTVTAITSYRLCVEFFPKALQIWWGANYYANALPPSQCWIVWDKENTGNFADAELAWCSDKSAVRIFKHMWNGMLKDSEHGQRRVHPTQKPCALFCWAAEKYGKPGDIVFDPFLGSGMSIIGAEMLGDGRIVIGCELSPGYIDVVIARWEKHTGETATLLERVEEVARA